MLCRGWALGYPGAGWEVMRAGGEEGAEGRVWEDCGHPSVEGKRGPVLMLGSTGMGAIWLGQTA